jgi:hypothetical protein
VGIRTPCLCPSDQAWTCASAQLFPSRTCVGGSGWRRLCTNAFDVVQLASETMSVVEHTCCVRARNHPRGTSGPTRAPGRAGPTSGERRVPECLRDHTLSHVSAVEGARLRWRAPAVPLGRRVALAAREGRPNTLLPPMNSRTRGAAFVKLDTIAPGVRPSAARARRENCDDW